MADETVVIEHGRVVVAPDIELKELVELVGGFLPFLKRPRVLETPDPYLDRRFTVDPGP